jgi:hypothetical protein
MCAPRQLEAGLDILADMLDLRPYVALAEEIVGPPCPNFVISLSGGAAAPRWRPNGGK